MLKNTLRKKNRCLIAAVVCLFVALVVVVAVLLSVLLAVQTHVTSLQHGDLRVNLTDFRSVPARKGQPTQYKSQFPPQQPQTLRRRLGDAEAEVEVDFVEGFTISVSAPVKTPYAPVGLTVDTATCVLATQEDSDVRLATLVLANSAQITSTEASETARPSATLDLVVAEVDTRNLAWLGTNLMVPWVTGVCMCCVWDSACFYEQEEVQ